MNLKLPKSAHNWISLVGTMIAVISFFMIVFLFTITLILNQSGSYIGLVIYILLPAVMITGLILIPVGMWINRKKALEKEKADSRSWPMVDLNNISHRNAFLIFTVGTTLFLFMSAVGSYEAFHYTESVEFCGTTCHTVMKPEHTAYQTSAHARVRCVDCHVGSGADWYIRSKLSGLYQVYSVLFNKYQKPIPTPIHNLRPARETCEQCHWPQKFYAQKLRLTRHYLSDVENTEWDIRLIMKIGSEYSAHGLKEGIHWHINPNVKIEYIANDEKQEEIPWVRLTHLNSGETNVYMDEENVPDESEIIAENIRTMDCMDCHNRPSHNYLPPAFFVNEAITSGDLPQELPELKSLTMQICENEYTTTDSALAAIRKEFTEFYSSGYPEIIEEQPQLIEQAITAFSKLYTQNIFPEMRVNWAAYPNHIGHVEFNGCFRCHSDTHVAENGNTISRDCNLCHIISAQGNPAEMEIATLGDALDFRHPVDIDEEWRESSCTDCHTGLNP